MATPANLETLAEQGFDAAELAGYGVNDLLLAAAAVDDATADRALDAGARAMFAARRSDERAAAAERPRRLEEALRAQPDSNLAVVSVPGEYAALEAHKALSAGLHVLLFSDNVPLQDEIALKERAVRAGRLLMGPGAGTALLGGTGLGFANVTSPGPVGVVAAAGTGAQEVMSLLDRWGPGVSHVIGVGGRDLSDEVGGMMTRSALRALDEDPATELVLLVSKPPSARVARQVLASVGATPVVAVLVGLRQPPEVPAGVEPADTLEGGVRAALRRLGHPPPDAVTDPAEVIRAQLDGLPAQRTLVRGLFSGGTLCFEALTILSRLLGPTYSNTPVDPHRGLPAPAHSHVCLDLGEEEYTRGRPHPMIDLRTRLELLRESGAEDEVAVILLDVVLGHGAHPDPAGELAPVCAEIVDRGGPRIVAYVLGTEHDPQGFAAQRARFADAGCVVPETSARAAVAAAAIASRDPALVGELP